LCRCRRLPHVVLLRGACLHLRLRQVGELRRAASCLLLPGGEGSHLEMHAPHRLLPLRIRCCWHWRRPDAWGRQADSLLPLLLPRQQGGRGGGGAGEKSAGLGCGCSRFGRRELLARHWLGLAVPLLLPSPSPRLGPRHSL
jgi:hypothetical protein